MTRKATHAAAFLFWGAAKAYRLVGPEKCTPDMKCRPPGPRTMELAMTVPTTVTMMPIMICENQPCMR